MLFASILNAQAPQAERRAGLLRVVPPVLALHILAVVALSRDWREPAPLPVRAWNDDALVLKLLAALPALPSAVAAAGITGEVSLRATINSRGQLLELELIGRCPHPVLCDSAQETVRNAQPFPPPPPELGNPCVLEMPFRYRLR